MSLRHNTGNADARMDTTDKSGDDEPCSEAMAVMKTAMKKDAKKNTANPPPSGIGLQTAYDICFKTNNQIHSYINRIQRTSLLYTSPELKKNWN